MYLMYMGDLSVCAPSLHKKESDPMGLVIEGYEPPCGHWEGIELKTTRKAFNC